MVIVELFKDLGSSKRDRSVFCSILCTFVRGNTSITFEGHVLSFYVMMQSLTWEQVPLTYSAWIKNLWLVF